MRHKTTIVAVISLGLIALAIYQVQRYFGTERPQPTETLLREVRVEPRLEEYDQEELRRTADTLENQLYKHVYEGLLGLEDPHRPSPAQAESIATAYARFLVLRRTATREQYLAEAKREPITGLLNEDKELAEKAWKYNSNWARHADIPAESIRVRPMFVRGEAVGDFAPQGKRSVRKLSNGELFSDETVGAFSVYQVLIDMTVPSIDASEEFDVTVGTMLANDGPQGAWLPVAVEFIGIPKRKFCFIPSP